MYFGGRKRRRRQKNNDQMVQWIVLVFVFIAFFNHMLSPKEGDSPLSVNLQKTAESIKAQGSAGLSEYKNKIFPAATTIRAEDIAAGEGKPVICGEKVSLAYKAFKDADQPIEDSASKDSPLSFTVGEHKVMPALEQGVLGMKSGGTRKIFAPMALSYGIKDYARAEVPENANPMFEVELVEADAEVPNVSALPFRIAITKIGVGQPLGCGDTAKVKLTVWDIDGKKLFPANDKVDNTLTFVTGQSDVFLGIEQGVMGMKLGETRTIIVPPALQKTLSGKPPATEIPLPEEQTVLVDLETVP